MARLGAANFGQGGVYLERFVERARHIEVQIFGDGAGNVIALGERDCSAQRRNQKVIEETPAPGLRDDVRRRLLGHRRDARRARSHYRSAGTVEFLYDADREDFFFLEVNTRLQVEHGVTEEVTGVDLVEWMVRLGAGDAAAARDAARRRRRARRFRCASTPRIRRTTSVRAPACSPTCGCRRACAATPGSSAAPR